MTSPVSVGEYKAALAANMKERGPNGLQERVRRLVLAVGRQLDPDTLFYHTHDSRDSPAGFPDVMILMPRRKRVIVAELKTEKGKVTEAQQKWLDAYAAVNPEGTYLWRPSDLLDGRIEEALRETCGGPDALWISVRGPREEG